MRAIMVTRFGAPDVLEPVELPTPEPGRGEIRVAVGVVNVVWMDARIRAGKGPAVFAVAPPYVPGSGVAGTVDAIGDDVDEGWLGATVVTRAGEAYGGGYADTVVGRPETSFPLPAGMDLRSAMAVMDDGSTALGLLEVTPVRAAERVLVAPGVGGLGNLLVQLLVRTGATVIAAVRGADKLSAARALGVAAVDYSAAGWSDAVRSITGGHGLDVVFDGVGGSVGVAAANLLVDGGRFSGYGMSSGSEAALSGTDRRVRVLGMSQLPGLWTDGPRRVRHVLDETAAGRLAPIIGRTYPLGAAAEAHADIEARRFIGKSLLLV
ncbi:zinc-binding dehydrogenase [Pseudonocardia sp. TRM90224]|uniref:zinc-binding dehydrogenase n=1 Tax=Pseudonocardia sp. TRM90224 TaxID=2812678 RepID=UPI001E59F3F0|nr:zinc-binding dehydrogenase [Pseudonocardia sp. TRM90224]